MVVATIDGLHPDLLLRIFLAGCLDNTQRLERLSRLSSVCSGWRALVAAEVPELHGYISHNEWAALSAAVGQAADQLDLSYRALGDAAFSVLAALGRPSVDYAPVPLWPRYSALREVLLGHNSIGDRGMAYLARTLPHGLRSLDISSNRIGDAGMAALLDEGMQHGSLAQLEQLRFCDNEVGDAGWVRLAAALPALVSLQAIFIGVEHRGPCRQSTRMLHGCGCRHECGNRCGTAGAMALAAALPLVGSALQEIYLDRHPIGATATAALIAAKRICREERRRRVTDGMLSQLDIDGGPLISCGDVCVCEPSVVTGVEARGDRHEFDLRFT